MDEPAPVAASEAPVAEEVTAAAVDNSEAIAETIEEIRFYLAQGMADQAGTSVTKLEQLQADPATVAAIREEISAASVVSAVPEVEVVEEIASVAEEIPEAVAEPAAAWVEVEPEPVAPPKVEIAPPPVVVAPPPPPRVEAPKPVAPVVAPKIEVPKPVAPAAPKPPVVAPAAQTPAAAAAASGVLGDLVHDLESTLGDDFLSGAAAEVPAPKPVPSAPPVAAVQTPVTPPTPQKSEIGALVADLESSLGDLAPQAPAPVTAASVVAPPPARREISIAASAAAAPMGVIPPAPMAQAPAASAPPLDAAGVDLAGMFSDLRHELEEDVATSEEDPETHYNLGVAFREMGLLDEAIGELQKVCQAVERGHAFPQLMQTYTWLAQCFLDKGVPEAAVRWYEQALKLPNIDAESSTALHYELGSSYEAAQDKTAALNHFLQVYGSNIDYRDVSERIKALRP